MAPTDALLAAQHLLDAMPLDVMVMRARDLRLLYRNAAAAQRPKLASVDLRELLAQPGPQRRMEFSGSVDASGEMTELLFSAEPVDYGGEAAWLISVQDLSELKRSLREKAAAVAASQAKSRFLTQISHELHTPLNAILGFAQLLQGRPPEEQAEPMRGWIASLGDAAWHLSALFEDLLDLARIEAGGLRLQVRPLELGGLSREVLRMAQAQADEAGIRLEAPEPSADCLALADPLRLRQVLLNLVTNAIKYNRRGGRVRIEIQPAPGALLLRVIDDGLGMDATQLARLFEPFNRLGREAGAVAGSGVGLALTRQLVLLMQGEIRVSSQPGAGTTVHLRLPLARMPACEHIA